MQLAEHGVAVWVAALSPLFALDGYLVKRGHPSLSEHAGNHPVVTIVLLTYLGAHLLGRDVLPPAIRRLDPLSAAANRLRKGH